jgi:transposase
MYTVEIYGRVRRAVLVEGRSERAVAQEFGIARETVRKMLRYSVPPGYRREQPAKRPKLGSWVGVIDAILEEDKNQPVKQRHTAKRIFDRLRQEYAYTGGYTVVKDYVRLHRIRAREMFVPLIHAPGEAQADFGEALVIVAGVECKAHYLAMDLPQSDDCFVVAFPAETTEAFLEGHVRAFAYFDGVPRRILYDNTKLAVAKILGGGERKKTRAFSELQSHYLFAEKFGRPGKGNDKGEGGRVGGICAAELFGADPAGQQLGGAERASAGAVPPAQRAVARARTDDCGTFRARSCGAVAAAGDSV